MHQPTLSPFLTKQNNSNTPIPTTNYLNNQEEFYSNKLVLKPVSQASSPCEYQSPNVFQTDEFSCPLGDQNRNPNIKNNVNNQARILQNNSNYQSPIMNVNNNHYSNGNNEFNYPLGDQNRNLNIENNVNNQARILQNNSNYQSPIMNVNNNHYGNGTMTSYELLQPYSDSLNFNKQKVTQSESPIYSNPIIYPQQNNLTYDNRKPGKTVLSVKGTIVKGSRLKGLQKLTFEEKVTRWISFLGCSDVLKFKENNIVHCILCGKDFKANRSQLVTQHVEGKRHQDLKAKTIIGDYDFESGLARTEKTKLRGNFSNLLN